jgi:lysozyme
MQTSAKGVAFIAALEGVVTRAYRDVAGVWTIGVGHTAAAGPPAPAAGMTVTRGEAFAILSRDLAACERRVRAALPGVPQTVFDGAVSFDFNTGAIHRATWVRRYRAGDMEGARAALAQWVNAGGRTIPGLRRRREAEARLIFEGRYGPEGDGAAPAVVAKRTPPDVRDLQTALATLGFYTGAIDGVSGPRTEAALRAYQAAHPDLVVDGIAGPATRASIERDLAARRQIGGPGIVGIFGTLAAWLASLAGGGGDWIIAAVAGAGVLVAAAAALIAHRRDLQRIFHPMKG